MLATHIDARWLGVREQLGKGGQGSVYRLRAFQFEPSWRTPTVYKEYDADTVDKLDSGVLERVIMFAGRLADEHWLRTRAAWPAATVIRDGRVCGFLMPEVPDEFYANLKLPNGPDRVPAGLEYLLNPPSYRQRLGILVSERDRVELLADLAQTLSVLHGAGAAVGDLSPKNLLYSAARPRRCFVLDCDSVHVDGASALPYAETPEWGAPEYKPDEPATPRSDVYKFALLAIRLHAGDQSTRDAGVLATHSPRLQELAQQSLDADPERRPSIAAWEEELERVMLHASELASGAGAQPPGLAEPRPKPARGRRLPRRDAVRVWRLPHAVFAAAVTAVCLFAATAALGRCAGGADARTAASSRVGLVDVSEVAGDRHARSVAMLFDAFFAAINEGRPNAALALFDPSNRLNPSNPRRRDAFLEEAAANRYQDVKLLSVARKREGKGSVLAELTYTATGLAEVGPSQRCARWRVSYRLSTSDGHTYRIVSSTGSRRPC